MTMSRSLPLLLVAALAATPAFARSPGMWGPSWGDPFPDRWGPTAARSGPDSREGKIDADSFVAQDARAQLGHGAVAIVAAPGGTESASDEAAYEAAIVDQLVKAGYDTARPDPAGGQVVEIKILRDTLVPEEQKRKPVSGETSVTVSNRGTAYGMALALDFTKPRKALLSTRLDAQIKDRTTGATLWEGHASIATREGDSHWSEQAIAVRLAAALFDSFPNASTAVLATR
jgi:hypothetical protein